MIDEDDFIRIYPGPVEFCLQIPSFMKNQNAVNPKPSHSRNLEKKKLFGSLDCENIKRKRV